MDDLAAQTSAQRTQHRKHDRRTYHGNNLWVVKTLYFCMKFVHNNTTSTHHIMFL